MEYYETVRKKFKPINVRVLFIAESRPNSGQFIYDGNSPLFDSLFSAFKEVFPNLEKINFLSFMKDNDYYLDDLCLIPVDKMDEEHRNIERKKGIDGLSVRLRRYNPEYIVCIMKGIMPYVGDAIKKSNITVLGITSTSFPAYSERNKTQFHDDVVNIIEKMNYPTKQPIK